MINNIGIYSPTMPLDNLKKGDLLFDEESNSILYYTGMGYFEEFQCNPTPEYNNMVDLMKSVDSLPKN